MIYLAVWWVATEVLGIIALPYTFRLFKNLPDRGYAFSKGIGILLPLYFIWLLVSGGILTNSLGTILLIVTLLVVGAALLFRKNRGEIRNFFSENHHAVIAVECVFLISFIILGITRSYTPQIYGTERPMDFAFVNVLLRTERFPPPDPWLTGYTLNNYYLGHLIVAIITRLTATPAGYSFNIGLCLFGSLAAIGMFSLIYNLVKTHRETRNKMATLFGLLGIMIFLILGNLEGILEVFYARGFGSSGFWEWVGIKGLTYPPTGGHWLPDVSFWWWRSTRVIDTVIGGNSLDYTITEYPAFSFILGDLHAHVIALPFTLVSIAFALNIFLTKERIDFSWIKRNVISVVIVLICQGALGAMHSWDLPTYTAVLLVALLLQMYLTRPITDTHKLKSWFMLAIGTVVVLIILYLPFYRNMKNPVMGVLPWQGNVSRPFHYLLIFGLFFFVIISMLIVFIKKEKLKWSGTRATGAVLITAVPLIIWGALQLTMGILSSSTGQNALSIGEMFVHLLPLLILTAFILFVIFHGVENPGDIKGNILFILLLVFLGIWITAGTELFYIGDIFNNRMNTIFRFYYQSWTMLATATTFGLYYLSYHLKHITGRLWRGIFTLLTVMCLILPAGALYDRISSTSTIKPTLDGTAYIQQGNTLEWSALTWLNQNVKGTPVILEATGGEYTEYGRVSINTGLPTVMGWAGHELVWRGAGKDLSTRAKDIDTIYLSSNEEEVKSLLAKYSINYVYFGKLEEVNYGRSQVNKFSAFMDTVFQNEAVTIYRVKTTDTSS